VAHIVFSHCRLSGEARKLALLGPLAVDPGHHRQGIGSQMIRAGFDNLRQAGVTTVLVLGDPGYYGRFGFTAEARIRPPYALPQEWQGAWQSLDLEDNPKAVAGDLIVPPPWRRSSLWLP
ncbi:MAG: N-acetyltransferase, partial [Pseudomonadota bacterium]